MALSDDLPEQVIRPWRRFSPAELAELWAYRELLFVLAWRDVSVRYKHTTLGVLWALLQPAAQTALFTLLFHRIAGIESSHGEDFVPFVLSGLLLWNVFLNGIMQASESLSRNAHLLTKVYFPRLILPLASLLLPLIDAIVALLLLAVVMASQGYLPWSGLLLVPPLLGLTLLAATGPGLFLAALNARFQDVRHTLPFFQQILLYSAPVFYPRNMVPEKIRWALDLNPVIPIIDALRTALFGGEFEYQRLLFSTLESLFLILIGFYYFRTSEQTLADRV